jgi:hypothetical protein
MPLVSGQHENKIQWAAVIAAEARTSTFYEEYLVNCAYFLQKVKPHGSVKRYGCTVDNGSRVCPGTRKASDFGSSGAGDAQLVPFMHHAFLEKTTPQATASRNQTPHRP